MKFFLDVGSTIEVDPGEDYVFEPGHDGWLIGNESCVAFEFGS